MTPCARHNEVAQAVRAGQWPQGCDAELRTHVSSCTSCADEVSLLSAFANAREGAMRTVTSQSPDLLWWKAQLRRRHQAMERMEKPGTAISATTITASIVLLAAVLATMWKQVGWSHLLAMLSPAGWDRWIIVSAVAALCGFALVIAVLGFGLAEERQ